jgi:cytochrome c biogenesis protein CcmG/thiol:disulfide interchange protein DsbE
MTLSKLKFAIPFALLFILLAVLWSELSSTRSYAYSPGILGEKAPTFKVPSLFTKKDITNQTLKGKVVILNFWASWCSACRAEHPMLMKIKNTYHIPIYGIAFKDDPNEARQLLEAEGNPYEQTGYDIDGVTGVDFGIYATPETFVISPKGDIVYKQIGVIDQSTWDDTIYPIIKKFQE